MWVVTSDLGGQTPPILGQCLSPRICIILHLKQVQMQITSFDATGHFSIYGSVKEKRKKKLYWPQDNDCHSKQGLFTLVIKSNVIRFVTLG